MSDSSTSPEHEASPSGRPEQWLPIGVVSERTGVAASGLRFYEAEGLIHAERQPNGQRSYRRDMLRRISFIRVAQQVGLSLAEIKATLADLPDARTPDEDDWGELASSWAPRIDHQIQLLERLRDRLAFCIGCGCLSLRVCRMLNPDDTAGLRGPGPRYVIDADDSDRGDEGRH